MDNNGITEDGGKETDPQIDCPLTIEDDVRLLDLERNFFETSTAVLMNGRKLHSLYEHIIKEVLVIERDKSLDRTKSVKVPVDALTSAHSSNDCDLNEASSTTQRKSMTISNDLTLDDLSVSDKSRIAEPNEKQTRFVKSSQRQKKKETSKSSIRCSFEVVVPRLKIDSNYISSCSSTDDQTGILVAEQVLRVNESLSRNSEHITHQQPNTSSMRSEIPLPVELDESNDSITRNQRTLRHRKRQAVIHDDSDDEAIIKGTPLKIPPPSKQDHLEGLFSPTQHLSTQHHEDTSMHSSPSTDESLKPKVQRRRSKRHLTVCDEDTNVVHTRSSSSQQNHLRRVLSSSQKKAITHSSVSPVSLEEKDSSWSPTDDELSASVSPQPTRTSRLKGKKNKDTIDVVKTQRRKKAQPSSPTYMRTRSSYSLSSKEGLDTYVTSKNTHDDSLSRQKDQFPENQSSLNEEYPLTKHSFVETTVTTTQEEPMKKPRNRPRKSRGTRKPPPAPYVQNKKKLSPSKSNEAQSVEQSLTSSRLSISSMGLRRKTLLNSRQDSTLFLQDTFNDESEKQYMSLRQTGGRIRVSSKDFVAPKLKISKRDKAV